MENPSTRRNGKVTRISANQWNLEIDHFWLVFNQKLNYSPYSNVPLPGQNRHLLSLDINKFEATYSTVRGKRSMKLSTESGLWNVKCWNDILGIVKYLLLSSCAQPTEPVWTEYPAFGHLYTKKEIKCKDAVAMSSTQTDSVTLSLRRPKRDLATNWEPSL